MGVRWVLAVLWITAGCRQILGLSDLPPPDAEIPADAIPDAAPCIDLGPTCVGDTLRTCTTVGQAPVDTPCGWGCGGTAPPHCKALVPTGGGVTTADLDPNSALLATTLSDGAILHDDGTINPVRPPGIGVINGIEFHVTNGIAIYRFGSLTATGKISLVGTLPIALVSLGDVRVATIDATGGCASDRVPGPGGGAGGMQGQMGLGMGGGFDGDGNNSTGAGGGGGGAGAAGGVSGHSNPTNSAAGGPAFGDDQLSTLRGGGGGGGGGTANGGAGGGGGGAVQIVSNTSISINGPVNAGGCGGRRGTGGVPSGGGGGGGAGGAILLEGPTVTVTSTGFLAVNGGSGAGGSGNGNSGFAATASLTAAPAGSGACYGAKGGASGGLVGGDGADGNNCGGGGGGAVGRIRIDTRSGTATVPALQTSPKLAESPTTTTTGAATTQ